MCEITERLCKKSERKGFAEGEAKGILKSIKKLVDSLGFTAEKAMDVLKIPVNERSVYFEKLKEVK